MRDHPRRLTLLANFESNAGLRLVLVAPGGLDEHVTTVPIAGFRDGTSSFAIPGRILSRDETQVSHELVGPRETAPIHQLAGEHLAAMVLTACSILASSQTHFTIADCPA
jgi:hypothetical protein